MHQRIGTGETLEESPQSKIKLAAAAAGLSVLLGALKLDSCSSMENIDTSLNNNWLTALTIMTITDALEVYLLMLSNISLIMEVLPLKISIHTLQLTRFALSNQQWHQ